jgi:energy-coupling factor transporter ATP-binding protein EcfA2
MQRLMQAGITTVFVSHNVDFLVAQCNRMIWLDKGHIAMDGKPRRWLWPTAARMTPWDEWPPCRVREGLPACERDDRDILALAYDARYITAEPTGIGQLCLARF